MVTTRFAPSPTGLLHLGHAYSARYACEAAWQHGGRCLLRIEDIDHTRCRREFATALGADLEFLGLRFDGPVRRQSEHLDDYERALQQLAALEVLYPCFCTRAEIAAEIAQSPSAPNAASADPQALGPRYPGRCRGLDPKLAQARIASGHSYALRLHVERAVALASAQGPLLWHDRQAGVVRATPFVQTRSALGGPSVCGATRPFEMSAAAAGRVQMRPAALLRCPMVPQVDRWISTAVLPAS